MEMSFPATCTGVGTTCKAIVSEISDDSTQAMGMAVLGAAWNAGYLVAPAVAAVAADPIGLYNITVTSEYADPLKRLRLHSTNAYYVYIQRYF